MTVTGPSACRRVTTNARITFRACFAVVGLRFEKRTASSMPSPSRSPAAHQLSLPGNAPPTISSWYPGRPAARSKVRVGSVERQEGAVAGLEEDPVAGASRTGDTVAGKRPPGSFDSMTSRM